MNKATQFFGDDMKIFFILMVTALIYAHAASETCNYEAQDCKKGFYCVNFEKGTKKCVEDFDPKNLQTIRLPYKNGVSVECDQGVLSPLGNSHTWMNTGFAIDLKTPLGSKAAEVISVMDGTVISHDGCKTENDRCGNGFGNQVKILSENGFMAFYSHLATVSVKTGDKIKIGDPIGVEGMTGWTGNDNRHLHFSLHHNWKTNNFDYWKNVGYLPPSVPFKLTFCKSDCKNGCVKEEIDIRSLACKRTSQIVRKLCLK